MIITSEGKLGLGTLNPVKSALLELLSTTKGMLPPRMTTTQMKGILTPVAGLLVYNTTLKSPAYYDGTSWFTTGGTVFCTIPTTPGTITGPSLVLSYSSYSYSISAVAGATSYTWSVSTTGSIVAGQGSTSVSVSLASPSTFWTINVTANNACGSSIAKTKGVIFDTLD